MKKELLVGLIFLTAFALFLVGCATISDGEIDAEAELLAAEEGIDIGAATNLVGQAYRLRTGSYSKNKIVWSSCSDTDGDDYYEAGEVTITYSYKGREKTRTYSDSCNKNQLREYYCKGDRFAAVRYTCPEGCEGGACIQLGNETNMTGAIHAETSPSKANFYIDNIYQGTTPKTAYDVEVGNRKVEFKKIGYVDYLTYVEVYEGKTTYVNATLEKKDIENCTDSDGGWNLEVRGTCVDFNSAHIDTCYFNSSMNKSILREHGCINGEFCSARDYDCEAAGYQKCENGACVRTQNKTCTDSDGGANIKVKGICTDINGKHYDECYFDDKLNKTFLREYYCVQTEYCFSKGYSCKDLGYQKCDDGACVLATVSNISIPVTD